MAVNKETKTNYRCIRKIGNEICDKPTAYGIVDLFLVNKPYDMNVNHIRSFLNVAICETCIIELFVFPDDWFWRVYV